MTYELLDTPAIVALARSRGILETELGKRMYRVFDSPPMIGMLREVVGLAIEQIVALALISAKTLERYTPALAEAGKNLAVWRGRQPTVISLRNVLREKNTWSAADCSDLIRLFGGIIEDKSLQQAGEVGKDVNEFRDAQRKGGLGFWEATRARSRKGYQPTPEAPHTGAAREAVLKFRRKPDEFAGITKTGLLNISTVKNIDFVFGLPEGCDISGTTADSIFFMRHVNAFIQGLPEMVEAKWLPVVQLLPVATMVSQAHHTLLECALTLTLNDIISYRVGFYTSLMPIGWDYAPLRAVFQTFESDTRNKHMLCFRDPQTKRLKACWYTDASGLHRFREAARVSLPFMVDFLNMEYGPTSHDLFSKRRFNALAPRG